MPAPPVTQVHGGGDAHIPKSRSVRAGWWVVCCSGERVEMLRGALGTGGGAAAPSVDARRLEAAAVQFIEDMEDKAEVPDRCAASPPSLYSPVRPCLSPLTCHARPGCTMFLGCRHEPPPEWPPAHPPHAEHKWASLLGA